MTIRTRLLLASALMLFLELALIRWAVSNVVHLGYFSNFVLLGSFLGVGIGFLRAGRTTRAPLYFPIALAVLVAGILTFPVTVNRSSANLIFFTAPSLELQGPPAWLALPLIFIFVAAVMAGPGELVGRCFPDLPRLEAYRFDLLGSLLGIATFTILSLLHAPPVVWGVIVTGLTLILLVDWQQVAGRAGTWTRDAGFRLAAVGVPLALVVGFLAVETADPQTSWSPYYKITARETGTGEDRRIGVQVNGIPHQNAMDAERKVAAESQYGVPYERMVHPTPGRVLVIGAGTGTDVALALKRGASSIDAVEIDPRIQQIGSERHPNRPYQDKRVRVHIDDGRAFLERTDQKFDTIIFALPDSLTLVAGASSLRLESYLFTVEAMRSAKEHLAPGGIFSMYNYYREQWLIGRLAKTVGQAFEHKPCVDLAEGGHSQAVVSAGLTEADQRCGTDVAPDGPAVATDDHPFVYLKDRTIPWFYLVTLAGILLLSFLAVRRFGGGVAKMKPYGDLFFLGAAFLLLETRSVTGFALLFGTTWIVNAIVFAGVLLVVLLAVEVTRRVKLPDIKIMYAALAGALLLAALIPPSLLLHLPLPLRLVAAISIAFLPVFLANLVFSKRFQETDDATSAFGANLLGAMVGGCLEYLTLVTGYQSLLIIAGLLYGAAFLLLRRSNVRVPVPA